MECKTIQIKLYLCISNLNLLNIKKVIVTAAVLLFTASLTLNAQDDKKVKKENKEQKSNKDGDKKENKEAGRKISKEAEKKELKDGDYNPEKKADKPK